MLTDTLDALLTRLEEQLTWLDKTIITAPGAGLTACPNPLLAGAIGPIRRTVQRFGPAYTAPNEYPRRRMVQFELRLAQCVPTEARQTTDISDKDINDRIEECDQAIFCTLTQGFTVEDVNGNVTEYQGYILGDSLPEPVQGGQQVTTWIVELPQCLEECSDD